MMNNSSSRVRCALLVVGCLASASVAMGARPETSDPEGQLPDGAEPGEFPTTVTATNVDIQPIAGSVFNGDGSNTLKVTFPASGPIRDLHLAL